MPHLCLIQDNRISRSFPLDNGEALLGRDDQCDIQLGFNGISRLHLRLLTQSGDTLVQDLGSRFGTYVNGLPAKQCVLHPGDILKLGEVELRFETDPANDETLVTPKTTGTGSAGKAHFTAKAEQLRLEQEIAHSPPEGAWQRFKNWLGL